MDFVGIISETAISKKTEILKVLQGVSVEDALDSLNSTLSTINLFTSEMNKKTLFDKQVIDDYLARPCQPSSAEIAKNTTNRTHGLAQAFDAVSVTTDKECDK